MTQSSLLVIRDFLHKIIKYQFKLTKRHKGMSTEHGQDGTILVVLSAHKDVKLLITVHWRLAHHIFW